jgi:hypothetical protein
MSQNTKRPNVKFLLLIFLALCVSLPGSARCQSGGAGRSTGRSEQPAVISGLGTQASTHEAPGSKTKQGSFLLTDVEPLLLLLFGLLLFSVATGIKLKLVKR